MPAKQWTPEKISQMYSQTWAGCALAAGIRLDLFTALDEGPAEGMEIKELADRIGAEPRALGMLVSALTALEFLERVGERISITDPARVYLSAKSDKYFGFVIRHMANILPAWAELTSAVKSGGPVAQGPASEETDEAAREDFLMGMFNVARQQADIVAAGLDLSGRARLLDLGGGPGTYAIHFCLHNPDLKAMVFDLPTTEKFARATIDRFGLTGRVDFHGGDFLADELPGDFDAAWLSQILHGETPADAAGLVKKGAAALKPGGILAVQEFILNDDRRGPAQPALFSLNMLVQTPGGQAYTQGELAGMMKAAGLADINRLSLDLPPGCGIMTGRKF